MGHQPAMYLFAPTSRIVINDTDYVSVGDSVSGGYVFRRVGGTQICETFSPQYVADGLQDGSIWHHADFFSPFKAKARLTRPSFSLGELSAKKQSKTLFRLDFCQRFLEMRAAGQASLSDLSMKRAIAVIAAVLAEVEAFRDNPGARCGTKSEIWRRPSPRTLRRWIQAFDAFGAQGLVDFYDQSGNYTDRLEPEARALVEEFALRYSDRRKPTKAQLHVDMRAKFAVVNAGRCAQGLLPLPCPSIATLYAEIKQLDAWEVAVGRYGLEAAKNRFFRKMKGYKSYRPLEVVMMDEHKIKLSVLLKAIGIYEKLSVKERRKVDRKRLWISVALDVATRLLLAAKIIENPSGETARATLREALTGRADTSVAVDEEGVISRHGIEAIATDNGAGFIDDQFRISLFECEIEHVLGPAKLPQMRGHIESFNRTFHTTFAARFDGRTFSNVVEKGDYNPAEHAVLDLFELNRLVQDWRVNVYNRRPHKGLAGEAPIEAWRRLTSEIRLRPPPHPTVIRHVFGRSHAVKLGGHGVRVHGLEYNSNALQEMRRSLKDSKTHVRSDDEDVGRISVRTLEGWLSVACVNEEMQGVTLHELEEARAEVRQRNAETSERHEAVLLAAVRRIQAHSDMATTRAGLSPPQPTKTEIDRYWREQQRDFGSSRDEEHIPFLEGVAADGPPVTNVIFDDDEPLEDDGRLNSSFVEE